MDNINELQERINNVYIEAFKNYSGNLNLSVPHIPRVSEQYLKTRTIVIGQETNTWYKETDDDLLNVFTKNIDDVTRICLTDRYDKFVTDVVSTYSGKFWEFNRLLYTSKILSGDILREGKLSHCWMNLFVVEACTEKYSIKGRPSKDWSLAIKIMIMQRDLLFKIFGILEPKLIICLTGHSLDKFLLENALCLEEPEREIKAIDSQVLDEKMLAIIKVKKETHPLFNTKVIRCYHPTYFMGYINVNQKLKASITAVAHQESNSNYYQNKLMNEIRVSICQEPDIK